MRVVVVGAGVIGVTTAYYLAKQGHDVIVLDCMSEAGEDTSFANGGQISVSHAEPWANPSTPLKALGWLGKEDAPLLWRWRFDIAQMRWGARFLYECTKPQWRKNIKNIVNLATYSRDLLADVRREAGIQNNHLQRGIIHFYTDRDDFADAVRASEVLANYGCHRRPHTPDQLVALEPALKSVQGLVGGTYTPEDESGDAKLFTKQLALHCKRAYGVEFIYNALATELLTDASREWVFGVDYVDQCGEIRTQLADATIICAASYSPKLVAQVGLNLNVYPVKGYSATIPIMDAARAPTISLTDDGHKVVFTRLGDSLRVAGTAEFNGFNTELNGVRCGALTTRTRELFGVDGFDWQRAEFWTGLRPATPSNVPYVGATSVDGLYLNTGHGTLGWTMACGSGAAIAHIVSGQKPKVDFSFTR